MIGASKQWASGRVISMALWTLLTSAGAALGVAGSSTTAWSQQYLLQWGSKGNADTQFDFGGAAGIACDAAGNVYVCDNGLSRIKKFTSTGGFLTKWGTFGSGPGQFAFDDPIAVAVDDSGHVIALSQAGRIQKFSASGAFIAQWYVLDTLNGTSGFSTALAVRGTLLYVTDLRQDRIQVFTTSGAYVTQWGSSGTAAGQFMSPLGIAVAANGDVFVVDAGAPIGLWRIQKFDSGGNYLATFGSGGSGDGQLNDPFHLWVGTDQYLYVADAGNHRIQVFSQSGEFLTKWGTYGTGNGQFDRPTSATSDGSGNVFVVDRYNYRVQKFGPVTPTRTTTWGRIKSMYR